MERPESATKIDHAVTRIVDIWQATQNERSTQLVFSDLSTPDPERFNVYHDVRSKLVKAGVPTHEIAFIHDSETDTANCEQTSPKTIINRNRGFILSLGRSGYMSALHKPLRSARTAFRKYGRILL